MSGGEIRVGFAALKQAAATLTNEAAAIEGLLEDERGILTTLGNGWNGEAKEAWHANQQRWQQKADELNVILDQLAGALNGVVEDYEKTENANKERWS
jgi:early secretory antigenic target protein ESAT-6